MKTEVISKEKVRQELARLPKKNRWKEIVMKVRETGEPIKVSLLTENQMVALYNRVRRDGDLKIRMSIKDGYVIVYPPDKNILVRSRRNDKKKV